MVAKIRTADAKIDVLELYWDNMLKDLQKNFNQS